MAWIVGKAACLITGDTCRVISGYILRQITQVRRSASRGNRNRGIYCQPCVGKEYVPHNMFRLDKLHREDNILAIIFRQSISTHYQIVPVEPLQSAYEQRNTISQSFHSTSGWINLHLSGFLPVLITFHIVSVHKRMISSCRDITAGLTWRGVRAIGKG